LTSVVATSFDPSAALAQSPPHAHDPVVTALAHDDHLLERGDASAQLDADLEHARLRVGRVVLVGGEAGVGKTSLVQAFATRHQNELRIIWGACEALFTPRPLGPVYDIVEQLDGWTAEPPTSDGERARFFGALLEELRSHPTVAVVEDAHWADEATLDALKYLGRRVGSTPSLLVLTYRDDEVGVHHPLRSVLGDLPSESTTRISLARLSPVGVEELARRAERPAHGLYDATGGNPFFVTEVLAGDGGDIPETVVDAVLARAARLSEGGLRLLEAVAVVPGSIEIWLLEELAGDDMSHLAECLASGMLVPTDAGVGFRHELARLALERSLTLDRRISLNEEALRALADQPPRRQDPSALAHHADAAGNAAAVMRYAPAAAARAAAVGAHREASEQFARALSYHVTDDAERLSLLDGYATEAVLTGRYAEALEARQRAVALARALDDRLRLGENLARVMLAAIALGLNDLAEEAGHEAVEVLEELPPGRELALAYTNQGGLRMLSRDNDDGVRWGERGLELAVEVDDPEIRALALNTIGTSHMMAGRIEQGRELLQQSLDVASEHGLHPRVASAYSMLASGLGEMYELEAAEKAAHDYIAFALEHDQDTGYIRSWLAAVLVYVGSWDEATALAQELLESAISPIGRITALIALGRVRARRGDPGAREVLDEALELSLPGGHLQRLGHVRAARAEAAWLTGDREGALEEAQASYELALEKRHLWYAGELAYWQWKCGELETAPDWIAEPYRRQLDGDPRGAAEAWLARGCAYEAARALAESTDEAALREALETFDGLGARPAAQLVRSDLRDRGASVPRGPRPATRENPARLTARELEVLELLTEGLRNAEIAERLVVSPRTVDHHVSAILRKLGAKSRVEAAAAAAQLGLLEDR
jgi:DNA-binding CsgD family transcriptional regulator/tetratricopeptide (TPR) repeat protein